MISNTSRRRTRLFAGALAALSVVGTARGDEPQGNYQVVTNKTVEHFVPDGHSRISSIEMQGEATVASTEVTLKQVCRWQDADNDMFSPVADLVVMRLSDAKPFDTISTEQLQSILRDAGVNPGLVNFAGAATCTVSRTDVKPDEGTALQTWVGSGEKKDNSTASAIDSAQADLIAAEARRQAVAMGKGDADPERAVVARNVGDLRARLITDVATRLNLAVETLQVDFKPEDRKFLSLNAPFEFSIEPQRYGDLGDVSWIVTASTPDGKDKPQRIRITATARAWMEQIVVKQPLGLRQTISEGDFDVKRILADKLSHDPLVTKDQAIGQQAAKDLRPGMVLTSRMIAPAELCHAGQLVTVMMRRGGIEVKSVATALQNGSAGQSIKVKNETTNQVFQVTLTGLQTAVLSASDPVASAR